MGRMKMDRIAYLAYFIRLVASDATSALNAPINKHTEMALGEFRSRFIHTAVGASASASSTSRLTLAGSRILNTIQLMKVPTNCGRVV